MCAQACRRLYTGGAGGGYYFSPADLQLLEQLPYLASIGINALKIEGRMKSADYVGAVTSAYRLVLDAVAEGGEENITRSIARGHEILRGDFARSKTSFYFFSAQDGKIDWLNPSQDGGTGIALGVIRKVRGAASATNGNAIYGGGRQGLVVSDNSPLTVKLSAGDSIRLHRGDDSGRVSYKLSSVEERDAAGGYWLSIPDGFGAGDRAYLIQNRAMSKRYRPVIKDESSTGKRGPAFEKAPIPRAPELYKSKHEKTGGRNKHAGLPEGLYVAVSAVNDLYIVQSERPAKVMLSLDRKNAAYILADNKEPLPFRPCDAILVLNPYLPQAAAELMASDIDQLIGLGYRQFVINNMGHFSLCRESRAELRLIAGPWLYMFNTWALSFIASLGVDGFISPLENNRQNLERTLGQENIRRLRESVFVPVFAWPCLFRIRADLGNVYGFKSFQDSRGELFSIHSGREETIVIPERPFSITDKIPFLKEAGFRRFIIDLSGPALKKKAYKDLMRSVNSGAPLPDISRFNWKDGFYNKE
jgi:putative protease